VRAVVVAQFDAPAFRPTHAAGAEVWNVFVLDVLRRPLRAVHAFVSAEFRRLEDERVRQAR
jgi:hypothetical protein